MNSRPLLVMLSLLLSVGEARPQAPSTAAIAIEHVTVIDVESGRRRADQTILVLRNRIGVIAATGSVEAPAGTRRINARGLYAIPGLWDMHVHTYRSLDIAGALYLANGVTGIRDMGARFGVEPVISLRDSIRAGYILGPRMVVGGVIANTLTGAAGQQLTLTPANAAGVVDSLLRAGVDFIKVTDLSPANFRAVYSSIRARGVPWAGHVPLDVDVREALDNGLHSHEHLWGLLPGCSTREDSLRRAIAARSALLSGLPNVRAEAHFMDALTAYFDEAKCAALIQHFARSGTFVGPTLLIYRQLGWPSDFANPDDVRLRYVPAEERARWLQVRQRPPWTDDMPEQRRLFERYGALLRQMAAGGVPILAGSDAGFGYVYHGFSLHDELASLVVAGLTPLTALQAATLNPARYLNAADSLGSLSTGKIADIVLLEGDPLSDIRNTTRIRAVIANGEYLDRDRLDQLLANAARRAAAR